MRNKAVFKRFENADSETLERLSGYIGSDSDAVKERIFQKSTDKYSQLTSDSESMGRNYARISHVTEVKRTGRALKIALSGAAAACAVAVGVWAVRPLLNGPDTVNNGYSVSNETIKRELRMAVSPDKATKEDIFWLMMNSIFYYDKVSGKIWWSTDIDEKDMDTELTEIDFQCSLSEDKGYVKTHEAKMNTRKSLDSSHQWSESDIYKEQGTKICYYMGNKQVEQDFANKETNCSINSGHKSIFDIEPIPDSERIKYEENENGRKVLKSDAYYPDPTPEMGLCVLFPQDFAGYDLYEIDKWSLSKNETVSGRECYHLVLPIVQAPNIARYDIWVDVKTGVIMKMRTTDSSDKAVGYLEVTEIHYEDEAEPVNIPADIIKKLDGIVYSEDSRENDEKDLAEMDSDKAKLDWLFMESGDLVERFPAICSVETDTDDSTGHIKVSLDDMSIKNELLEYLKSRIGSFDESIIEFKKGAKGGNYDLDGNGEDVPKEDIFSLMMGSIYRYQNVSGRYYIAGSDVNSMLSVIAVDLQSNLTDGTAYSAQYRLPITDSGSEAAIKAKCKISLTDKPEMVQYCDGTYIYHGFSPDKISSAEKAASTAKINEAPANERIKAAYSDDEYAEYEMYPDVTNTILGTQTVFPQYKAVMNLSWFNRWENKGFETIDGRVCYHLSGKLKQCNYRDKNDDSVIMRSNEKVKTFDMWVDTSTGVLMKYIGFNSDGNICDFTFSEDVRFDNDAKPVTEIPEDVKKQAVSEMVNGKELFDPNQIKEIVVE